MLCDLLQVEVVDLESKGILIEILILLVEEADVLVGAGVGGSLDRDLIYILHMSTGLTSIKYHNFYPSYHHGDLNSSPLSHLQGGYSQVHRNVLSKQMLRSS